MTDHSRVPTLQELLPKYRGSPEQLGYLICWDRGSNTVIIEANCVYSKCGRRYRSNQIFRFNYYCCWWHRVLGWWEHLIYGE
jgi:hypothetical protein